MALADRLRANGADAVVLFNRLYPTDIDIDKMEYTMSHPFTTAAELSNSLRWAGLVSAAVPQLPVAVSGGVHAWQDVVKSILAGASAVEVSSVIYGCGKEWIAPAVAALEKWQQEHSFDAPAAYSNTWELSNKEHAPIGIPAERLRDTACGASAGIRQQ